MHSGQESTVCTHGSTLLPLDVLSSPRGKGGRAGGQIELFPSAGVSLQQEHAQTVLLPLGNPSLARRHLKQSV